MSIDAMILRIKYPMIPCDEVSSIMRLFELCGEPIIIDNESTTRYLKFKYSWGIFNTTIVRLG